MQLFVSAGDKAVVTFEAMSKNNNLKLQNVAAQVLTRTKRTEKITPVEKTHTVSQSAIELT